ncbi:MAG: GNAT family N-acetyltransferase [Parvularculaceae bacterium]|nr:GNAT family N-acetyltransferase [Parvularculaceae bacterium]
MARHASERLSAAFVGVDDLRGMTAEWRDLEAAAVEPNPFYAPAMLLPALDAFAAEKPEVAVIRDGAKRLIGLAPVAPINGYSRLPVRYLATWMHPHCYFAAPLVRRGFERAFFGAFFGLVEDRGAFLRLRHLDASGPLFAAAGAVAADQGRLSAPSARYQRAMLRSPWSTDDYLKEVLSGKRRKELRRLRARLEDEGAVRFEVFAGGDIDPWAEEFLLLEASGWKGRNRTALLQDDKSARFFKEAATLASAAGALQIFRLLLGSRAIASAVNFRSGEVSYAFKIAYDEEYARYSPGVMIEIEIMKALEGASSLDFIDSCAQAEHPMIDRLWKERRTISALNVSRRDAPAKALFHLLTALERASEKARRAAAKPVEANDDDL